MLLLLIISFDFMSVTNHIGFPWLLIWRLILLIYLNFIIFNLIIIIHYGVIYWLTIMNKFETIWQRNILGLNHRLHLVQFSLHALSFGRLMRSKQDVGYVGSF